MESRWNAPFAADVDTNISALDEWTFGGSRASRLLYVTLSTGVGGGLLVDGKIYRGSDGAHPEVGHQSINFRCSRPDRIECECGAPDCLEALVSGNGIRRIYGVPAEDLQEDQWSEVTWNLAQGLRNAAALYAPEVIVLGGGVALAREEKLLAPTREIMENHLKIVPPPELRLSALGPEAPLMGAVAAAMNGLE
jgi:predicted NBD/HSP70 family sugar kinase